VHCLLGSALWAPGALCTAACVALFGQMQPEECTVGGCTHTHIMLCQYMLSHGLQSVAARPTLSTQ